MIHPKSSEAYQLLHQGVLSLARAEQQGMRIDMDYCVKKEQHLVRKIEYLEKRLQDTKFYRHWSHTVKNGTPNIYSPIQLSTFLYKVKKITPAKTTEGGHGATDEDALKALNIPELNMLLDIRKLKKIKDTYLQAFIREQVNGYIHPFYNLHTVRTFRSSSDSPNFQNIPKRDKEAMKICRKAIYPRPGHQLMEADFSKLEVSIAACYHKDPTMLKYLTSSSNDMHGDMAQQLYMIDEFNKSLPEHGVLRAGAKNGFVFPQFYGDYYKNCAVSLANNWGGLPEGKWKPTQGFILPGGVPLGEHFISKGIKSMDAFMDHVQRIEAHFWNKRFPVYKRWKEEWWRTYQKQGYVDMLTGFRCSGVMGRNDAINYPVQGSAFHCLLWSFIRLDQIIVREKLQTRLLGQIHDAIILDIYPPELGYMSQVIKRVTTEELPQSWSWINVPLQIEADLAGVDESWADVKPFDLK